MKDIPLTNSLLHEYLRAKQSYDLFCDLVATINSKQPSRSASISCYNIYLDFVAHLYEFWAECIRSDGAFSKSIKAADIDLVFNKEAEKLLSIRRMRIANGRELHDTFHTNLYNSPVPSAFGSEFRHVRNIRSHVKRERYTYDLANFFHCYNGYLKEMLTYPELAWGSHIDEHEDWGEIQRFATEIFKLRT